MTEQRRTITWGHVILIILLIWLVPSVIVALLSFIAWVLKILLIIALTLVVAGGLLSLYNRHDDD